MGAVLVSDPRFEGHDTGLHHPECPERVAAVLDGIGAAHLDDRLVTLSAERASVEQVALVHDAVMVERARESCAAGGALDPDTPVVPASWDAALLAAGSGLVAVQALVNGNHDAAFCVVRPPGHHATRATSMGFCVLNNVAVCARSLADAGERVLIADIDAHHGNGTQDVFWDDPRVLFASWHQWPLYPGTGAMDDTGGPAAPGSTLNFPLPPGATGDHYRRLVDLVLAPAVERFEPTWLLISAGFDAHRDDPLTSMGLTDGDVADLIADLCRLVPRGRVVAFLEGGYSLPALGRSAAAMVAALTGDRWVVEPPTTGGPGSVAVERIAAVHQRLGQ